MSKHDCGFNLVPVLTARPVSASCFFFQLFRVNVKRFESGVRNSRNRHGAGMNSASFFIGGYALESVSAALAGKQFVVVASKDNQPRSLFKYFEVKAPSAVRP